MRFSTVLLAPAAELPAEDGRPGLAALPQHLGLEAMGSTQQLCFAEWCCGHTADKAGHALFLADFSAAVRALAKASLVDQAVTLDLLVHGFVASGVLGEALAAAARGGLWEAIQWVYIYIYIYLYMFTYSILYSILCIYIYIHMYACIYIYIYI